MILSRAVTWTAVLLLCTACADARRAKEGASERKPRAPQPTAAKPNTDPQPPAADDEPSAGVDEPTTKPDESEPATPPTNDKPADEPLETPPNQVPPPMHATTEWRMLGYDEASTFFNRNETKLTKQNAGQLKLLWQASLDGNVYGAPLQVGSRIYASCPTDVRAFEADSGKELWRAKYSSLSSLAYADGTLYYHTGNEGLVALNAEDGTPRWTSRPDPSQRADGLSSPIIAGDYVFVGGSNASIEISAEPFRGYLSALDRQTGKLRWIVHTVKLPANGAGIWSSPSIDLAAGRVFGTTGNNYGDPATTTSDAFLAIDLKEGELLWTNQRVENDAWGGSNFGEGGHPDADFGANPVLYEAMIEGKPTQLVSAGSKAGEAHALRRDDGKLVWTRRLCLGSSDGMRGIYFNSTWSGKHMLFGCNEGETAKVFALDGASGDVVWQLQLKETSWSRISVANGVGFVGSGSNLIAFDIDTGAEIHSYPSPGGTVASTITIANGRVAFGEGLSWANGRSGFRLTVLTVP